MWPLSSNFARLKLLIPFNGIFEKRLQAGSLNTSQLVLSVLNKARLTGYGGALITNQISHELSQGIVLLSSFSYLFRVLLAALCLSAGSSLLHAEDLPKDLDFVGGHFENGVYKCYAEPCFTLHKHDYPEANNIKFNIRNWPHWLDIDRNCQKENVQVLAIQSEIEVAYIDDDECKGVLRGQWTDLYTGNVSTNVEEVVVDHRVSLQEAHANGGLSWARNKRAFFANTTENLIVVSKAEYESRNGASAKDWMPPNKDVWCDYVVHRERIYRKFELNVPDTEKEHNREIKRLYCKY